MFSRKTRKGLLGGVALALAGLMAGEAGAVGGMLITNDFCEKYNGIKNLIWGNLQTGRLGTKKYDGVYYMRNNGDVVNVIGDVSFGEVEDLLVISHGNCGRISGKDSSEFAVDLSFALAGHQNTSLQQITVASCKSASSSDDVFSPSSVLSYIQSALEGQFRSLRLNGWRGSIMLIGNGGPLEEAQFSDAFKLREAGARADFKHSLKSILFQWEHEPVEMEMLDGKRFVNTYQGHCKQMLDSFELKGENVLSEEDRSAMFTSFFYKIEERFLPHDENSSPLRSFARISNFLEIPNNDNQMISCGPGVPGSRDCP